MSVSLVDIAGEEVVADGRMITSCNECFFMQYNAMEYGYVCNYYNDAYGFPQILEIDESGDLVGKPTFCNVKALYIVLGENLK